MDTVARGTNPGSAATVLIVDDDPEMLKLLARTLVHAGLVVRTAHNGEAALEELARAPVDVVLTDRCMPRIDGMELLAAVMREFPGTQVIMATGHATIELAVEAMKAGAADFVTKPVDPAGLVYTVRKAAVAARRADESSSGGAPSGFVGTSDAMRDVHRLITRAAAGTSTILFRGESGTGKDLAAHAIHEQSPRRGGPFLKVHCAALPEALLESELFGYEKGAFTGATARKPGRVELAQGGTLFLDEIGDVSLTVQVKLLRVLQDREFERLGGTQTLKADVRLVAATHRDLERMVQERAFREDLFYRLSVVPIWLPPLRDRRDDVAPIALHFASVYGAANGRPATTLDPAALELVTAQTWPGNVRQLQNFVERLVVLSDGPVLCAADVSRELGRHGSLLPSGGAKGPGVGEATTLDDRRREMEREAFADALKRAGGNRTLAARLLGVSRRGLYNKLEEYGLL